MQAAISALGAAAVLLRVHENQPDVAPELGGELNMLPFRPACWETPRNVAERSADATSVTFVEQTHRHPFINTDTSDVLKSLIFPGTSVRELKLLIRGAAPQNLRDIDPHGLRLIRVKDAEGCPVTE
ncbi:hypothetical protein BJ742DRAFT_746202 [Cladochytrium replicatum]|nr:hypothetical protein BJ742DRAFT_746202 [Cladochytrium replicatum]